MQLEVSLLFGWLSVLSLFFELTILFLVIKSSIYLWGLRGRIDIKNKILYYYF